MGMNQQTIVVLAKAMVIAGKFSCCTMHDSYSGSGMHGRTCLAVEGRVTDWIFAMLQSLAEQPEAIRMFSLLLRDAKLDTAKRRKVLYFPHFEGEKSK